MGIVVQMGNVWNEGMFFVELFHTFPVYRLYSFILL